MAREEMTKEHKEITKDQIIKELKKSYSMELETVINYLAISVHLDGVRADEIRKALGADVTEELGHAKRVAKRLKVLDAAIPGSLELKMEQRSLQPPHDMTDVVAVIHGVIEAEEGAIKQYNKLVELCDGVDWVTQELCIELMGDEEEHRRLFTGYLTEYERHEARQRQVA